MLATNSDLPCVNGHEKAIKQTDEIWDKKGYSAEQLLSEHNRSSR